MAINSIIEIIPALIGFTISGFLLRYFILRQNQKGIIISSLLFLVSGFVFQIIWTNLDAIKEVSSTYKEIFSIPIVTIFSTAIGIFLGNTMLRELDKQKQQKEIAAILVNIIDAKVDCMKVINYDVSMLSKSDIKSQRYAEKSLKIYLSQLSNFNSFESAFQKIGIYSETEIDYISAWFTRYQNLISQTNQLILEYEKTNQLILDYERTTDKNILNWIILDKGFWIQFAIVKTDIVMIMFLGFLCLIQMSKFYSLDKMNKYQKNFESFFMNILTEFDSRVFVMEELICEDFMMGLDWLKDNYSKSYKTKISLDTNFYICFIKLSLNIINEVFDTNIGICDNPSIYNSANVISFGKSEEDAIKNAKQKLNSLLDSIINPPEKAVENYQKNESTKNKTSHKLLLLGIVGEKLKNEDEFTMKINKLFPRLSIEVKNISPWK